MALTKADMAESLFNELGLNKREARELVDLYFEELRASLAVGEQVKLSGFGNFDGRNIVGIISTGRYSEGEHAFVLYWDWVLCCRDSAYRSNLHAAFGLSVSA